MERYHIYKLGLAILFYAVYYTRQTVVSGLKIDDVASTTNITDYRERRDAKDDNPTFYQGADGVPGIDFPTLSYVPRTQFSCKEMEGGYYADIETNCQVFHICDEGRKLSFLCPNGTIFQQAELICDWWYKVNCTTSPSLYEESAEILQKENEKRRKQKQYGTKQSVFEDFGRDHGGGHEFRITPSHFVTPSYPYKSSIDNVDNRISASTEGSNRRNYDSRFDRKLEVFGNGVREGASDKGSGRGQNAFNANSQGQTEFSGSRQNVVGGKEKGSFLGKNRDQSAFSTTTSARQGFGFNNFGTTPRPNQSVFGTKTEGAVSSMGENNFSFGNRQRGGGQLSIGDTSQSSFGFINQQIGTNQVTSERNLVNQNVANTQRISTGSNQNSLGLYNQRKETGSQSQVGVQSSTSTQDGFDVNKASRGGTESRIRTSFGSGTSKTSQLDEESISHNTPQQQGGSQAFNAGLSTIRPIQNGFGKQNTFGSVVQQTNKNEISSRHSIQTSTVGLSGGRDRNEFNVGLQGKTPSTQGGFGGNVQETGIYTHDTSSQKPEQGLQYSQRIFGQTTSSANVQSQANIQTGRTGYNTFGDNVSENVQGRTGYNSFGNNLSGSVHGQANIQTERTRYNTLGDSISGNVQGQANIQTGRTGYNTFVDTSSKTSDVQSQTTFGNNLINNKPNAFAQGVHASGQVTSGGVDDKTKLSISSHSKFDTSSSRPSVSQQSIFGYKLDKTTPSTLAATLRQDLERIPVKVVSAETQEPQETASFVTSSRNNLQASGKLTTSNPYPNHRETYSDIKDPRHYYEKPQSKLPEKPFYGTSINPQVLSTIPVSAYDSEIKATTELSLKPDKTRYSFGLKTDVSTTRQPSVNLGFTTFQQQPTSTRFSQDGTGIDFSTSKTPPYKQTFGNSKYESHAGITVNQRYSTISPQSGFSLDLSKGKDKNSQSNVQTESKSSTIGFNKVSVNTYDKGYTNAPDARLNAVSSTFRPDISGEIGGKSTAFPGSEKSLSYEGKSSTSTGINDFKSRETFHTDSPIIKVNILQSTPLPDFESSGRTGKAFSSESPKTQISLHGSKSTSTTNRIGFNVEKSNKIASTLSPYDSRKASVNQNTFGSFISPVTSPSRDDGTQGISTTIRETGGDLGSRFTANEGLTSHTVTNAPTAGFTVNDEVHTTPFSILNDSVTININEQNYTFYTSSTPISSNTEPDIFYSSSSSGILQPKPFSTPTKTPLAYSKADENKFTRPITQQLPSYTVSSASPFTTARSSDEELNTISPTLPTVFTTGSDYDYPYKPTDENINNMINTLMEVVRQRLGGEGQLGTPRPGLVVPPSAGPQTLHSLAVYFANALDNLTATHSREHSESDVEGGPTDSPIIHIDNEELIKSLLTHMTLSNYEELFKDKGDATTTEISVPSRVGEEDNDLTGENTKHPTEGPGVRQLARVFTEALSAYLDDPVTFKKVLHDVRPKEPPSLSGTENEEEEVLNYSDSDLKSDHPHLPIRPTGIPISPTWGYILALNKSSTDIDKSVSGNSISSENENLQSADTQSFVPRYNKITQELKTTLSIDETVGTTEKSFTEDLARGLPDNHWTTSSDVAKLWQTTLSINPALLNENFNTDQTSGFTSSDEIYGEKLTSVTNSDESTEDTTRVSEIQYELRALPKLELNSTQVHGILIDFMNSSKSEGPARLQRILHKLNISQEEFLDKMKEIEGNPLTRRLILLLISECNSDRNGELETRATEGDSIFSIAESKIKTERHDGDTEAYSETTTDSSSYKTIIHPSLDEGDEDTRALELLNSLYVIASKFGK